LTRREAGCMGKDSEKVWRCFNIQNLNGRRKWDVIYNDRWIGRNSDSDDGRQTLRWRLNSVKEIIQWILFILAPNTCGSSHQDPNICLRLRVSWICHLHSARWSNPKPLRRVSRIVLEVEGFRAYTMVAAMWMQLVGEVSELPPLDWESDASSRGAIWPLRLCVGLFSARTCIYSWVPHLFCSQNTEQVATIWVHSLSPCLSIVDHLVSSKDRCWH
jgi:hypothetical protein